MRRVILITAIIGILLSGVTHGFVANDPSQHTPNARVIGLGSAYVGLADDSASIYTNPAGLSGIGKLQLSSMFGSFMEEYSYTSFTLAYPTKYGVFGFGYAGSSIAGAPVSRIKAGTENTADPIYEIDTSKGTVSNSNAVAVLSYGTKADRFIENEILTNAKVAVGASLRLFSAGLSGGGITGGDASGMDLDLGAQAQPISWLKVGVVGKHILPASMGGKLTYAGGHSESYPATLVLGTSVKVLGGKDAVRSFRGQEVTLVADVRSNVTQKLPTTAHVGVEWKPVSLISLRVGVDQAAVAGGVENNLSAGVGLNMKGFRFDYGYHQFASAPGMSNNYFSISYGLPEIKTEKKELVKPVKKLELIRFKDVPDSHWAYNQISLLATQGIIKGYPNQTFRPEGKISRAELATLLVRTSDAKIKVGKPIFRDVSTKHWAFNEIYTAAKLSIVNGYPNYVFKPINGINRAEGLAMIVRFADVAPVKYSGQFKDVKGNHWAAKYIAGAKTAELLSYIGDGKFDAQKRLTRAEAVEMLYKTQKVQGILAKGILKDYPNLVMTASK
ncbi:MAG: S-layer homology domain-containing protein [Candidatus Saganbacteria bacterium]|nr:S-layer homology domain-containing protein [Candidatus Saganbacteria bacterium]